MNSCDLSNLQVVTGEESDNHEDEEDKDGP